MVKQEGGGDGWGEEFKNESLKQALQRKVYYCVCVCACIEYERGFPSHSTASIYCEYERGFPSHSTASIYCEYERGFPSHSTASIYTCIRPNVETTPTFKTFHSNHTCMHAYIQREYSVFYIHIYMHTYIHTHMHQTSSKTM